MNRREKIQVINKRALNFFDDNQEIFNGNNNIDEIINIINNIKVINSDQINTLTKEDINNKLLELHNRISLYMLNMK